MEKTIQRLVLADDDLDDCSFFREALEEIPVAVSLTVVHDGVELMRFLSNNQDNLPDLLFLDLNMPRKTGFECLTEIKAHDKLKYLPVIIYSTSLDIDVLNLLHEKGAGYYVRKPGDFSKLKKVIHEAILISSQGIANSPSREKFVLQP
jgi:CheY-like chemotaxis protein